MNASTTPTIDTTGDAGQQLREMADQLDIFSDVLASSYGAVTGGGDERTVAAFAISRISAELAGFSRSIYSLTGKGGVV